LVLTNFFAVLGGMLLGPIWGGVSTALYLLVGALGFPVFSGGRGGLAYFAGPTGGYLIGYFGGAVLSGFIAQMRGKLFSAFGAIIGFASILIIGAIGLKLLSGMLWTKALAVGILPFLTGDAIKAVIAAVIAIRLGPFVDSLTTRRVNHA
jgi:biotin transport system substrate-specific component